MELKTPLYDCHVALGGKIVPFAGYLLPVQYESGVITEHKAVRTAAGLFDVSHMGEVTFSGPDALQNLQQNRLDHLKAHKMAARRPRVDAFPGKRSIYPCFKARPVSSFGIKTSAFSNISKYSC